MRCLSCDEALTDSESVRKSSNTGEFLDLCNACFSTISEDIATYDDQEENYDQNTTK